MLEVNELAQPAVRLSRFTLLANRMAQREPIDAPSEWIGAANRFRRHRQPDNASVHSLAASPR